MQAQDRLPLMTGEASPNARGSSSSFGLPASPSSASYSGGKFWNFCHACADTSLQESVAEPAVYRKKLAAAAVETAVQGYLVYLFDYCVVSGANLQMLHIQHTLPPT